MLTRALHPVPVEAIVVGGSAGAVEALGSLLPALPAELPVPVVIVVHQTPRRPSLFTQIFAPRCALPVAEPEDKQAATRGIWFASPDYHLLIERDRTFSLSIDEPVRWSRPSIDVLFQSASDVYGAALAAVVLTGSNEDGAVGAAAVHRAGGLVLVQSPDEAEAAQMPRAAIHVTTPALVGTLAEIAETLRAITMGTHG